VRGHTICGGRHPPSWRPRRYETKRACQHASVSNGHPACGELIAPIVFTGPLQLLAYHVAVLKGTDVDKPRNLVAKRVTVE